MREEAGKTPSWSPPRGRHCPPPFETAANFPLKPVFASLLSAQVKSLRDQLPTMINSIFSGREEDVLDGLSDLTTTLYEMDGQGVGLISVDLALNVRSFFEDVSFGASIKT